MQQREPKQIGIRSYHNLLLATCSLLVFLTFAVESSNGARILAAVTVPSYSHQIAFREIWKELCRRGHELVLVTTDPIQDKTIKNLTQIDINDVYKYIQVIKYGQLRGHVGWLDILDMYVYPISKKLAETVFEHPTMLNLYAPGSAEKFDVVIIEAVLTPSLFVLSHRFKAPLIGLSSLLPPLDLHYRLGNPVMPSHPSTWEMETRAGFNLPLWRRVKNYLELWYFFYKRYHKYAKEQQFIADKYLGNESAPILELERDMSLAIVVQPAAMSLARPNVPKVISISGLHISKNPDPLSKDLQKFVDDAKEGFIYVSLGTNAQLSTFSQEIQNTFIKVLASLPYKIVCKFKGELSEVPKNAYVSSWFPQQSILAHPNIKLFIYQGGIQSTEEALYYGVPLVGLPVLADQDYQVTTMKMLGVAESLEITKLTEETFRNTILEVINNPKYKQNMMKLRAIHLDRPYDQLQHAVWWIEHVIRHKGASYLQSTTAYEPWYQRDNFDVIVTLTIIVLLLISCATYALYKFITFLSRYLNVNQKLKIS